MSRLLDDFLEKTVLLDEDRKTLRQRRGFDDVLISSSLFRSARKENAEVILGLLKEYGQSASVDAGLIYVKNGKPLPTIKLTERNIIIPYMDEGTCVALRSHKY